MEKEKKQYKYPNIVAEMAKRRETQASLGEIIGLTPQQLRMKLYGKYDWTISEIDKLCSYYGKDYYELFKGE